MKREAAERIAAELDVIRKEWMDKVEREYPGYFMTEEQRKERGIPDISDRLQEGIIEELMKVKSKFPEDNEDWENEEPDLDADDLYEDRDMYR